MNITLEAEEFWEAFCDHNADLNKEELYYDVWQFLDGKRGCDRLASLCLAGIKTATSSVYETFEIDDMKVPEEGDYSIILDSDEVPLFILKDVNVEIKKFSEIEEEFAAKEGAEVLVICAKTEEELSQMDPEDKAVFMEEFGLGESGLDRLIKKSYALLGLISYLTAGEKETRAWTIVKGTKAPQAAGKIHTDFEKGFIRADVVNWEILLQLGSTAAAKEKGKVRSEGKEYVMQDGDVVEYYFNVSKSNK
jgi:uncharacterized protein YhfF